MKRATEAEQLLNRLIGLEALAAGCRRNPGANLRLMEQEHGNLLGEYVKVTVRARLASRTRPSGAPATGTDPLATRRQRAEVTMLQQFAAWDLDEAAGRALPPAHDAMTFAATILEGSN